MNAEIIISTLLGNAAITALVGNRRALFQLPQNTAMPAVVYNLIDNVPEPVVAYQEGPQRARSRVQINVLANTIAEVKSIHATIRSVLDFTHQTTVAGKNVVSCRVDIMGPMDKDPDTGVFNQPIDYILQYYE